MNLFDVIGKYEKEGKTIYQKNYWPNLSSAKKHYSDFKECLPDRNPQIIREWKIKGENREFFNNMIIADEWYKKLIRREITEDELPLKL